MSQQQQCSQFGALLRQAVVTELRARAWAWMALTMLVVALIIRLIPVPFWTDAVSLRAVMGSNIAIISITIAVVSGYGLSVLKAAIPLTPGRTACSAVVLGRIALGSSLAIVALALEAMIFVILPTAEGSLVWEFLWTGSLLAVWIVAVLVPWALLSRLLLGQAAAPWAMLALIVVAAWAGTGTIQKLPIAIASRVLPMIPENAAPAALLDLRGWLYVLTHAAAITLASVPLVRRPFRVR
jgi:hypothetical protein